MSEARVVLGDVPEVTMLIVMCRGDIVLLFDQDNPRRGWTFVSTTVQDNEEPIDAIRRTASQKLGIDVRTSLVRFVKRKEKKGIPFSSFAVELTPDEFHNLPRTGPCGHSVRVVSISALPQYLDKGRYDMGVSGKTGIPPR